MCVCVCVCVRACVGEYMCTCDYVRSKGTERRGESGCRREAGTGRGLVVVVAWWNEVVADVASNGPAVTHTLSLLSHVLCFLHISLSPLLHLRARPSIFSVRPPLRLPTRPPACMSPIFLCFSISFSSYASLHSSPTSIYWSYSNHSDSCSPHLQSLGLPSSSSLSHLYPAR